MISGANGVEQETNYAVTILFLNQKVEKQHWKTYRHFAGHVIQEKESTYMQKEKNIYPDFLIIPFQLIRDQNLQPIDRILYGIIYWFERLKDGSCASSNTVLAELIDSNEGSVSNSLRRLEKGRYIKKIFSDKGGKNRNRVRIETAISYAQSYPQRQSTIHQKMYRDTSNDGSLYKVLKSNRVSNTGMDVDNSKGKKKKPFSPDGDPMTKWEDGTWRVKGAQGWVDSNYSEKQIVWK